GEQALRIGNNPGDTASPEDRFAMTGNGQAVVVLPASLVRELLAAPLQFHDRTVARVSGVDRVALERGSRKAVFAKMDSIWKMTQPVEAEVEQTDLDEFLNGLSHLRADELVADRPPDPKLYGLEKPEARWRLSAGDKLILDLLIGSPEKLKEQSQEKN